MQYPSSLLDQMHTMFAERSVADELAELQRLRKQGELKQDNVTWGDWLGPAKLTHRHKYLAAVISIGATPNEAADRAGFSRSRMRLLMTSRLFLAEIERHRSILRMRDGF